MKKILEKELFELDNTYILRHFIIAAAYDTSNSLKYFLNLCYILSLSLKANVLDI